LARCGSAWPRHKIQFFVIVHAKSYYENYDNTGLRKIRNATLGFYLFNLCLLTALHIDVITILLTTITNIVTIIMLNRSYRQSKREDNSFPSNDTDPVRKEKLIVVEKYLLIFKWGGYILLLMVALIRFNFLFKTYFNHHLFARSCEVVPAAFANR
jgi:hypothetical protein